MDPKRIVADGYDVIAQRYLEWSPLRPSEARRRYLDLACDLIPAGARVLELGCGAGIPMTAALADGRDVTGVDISATQIALARENVPSATFLQADMTALDFPPDSFDAVVAFYSLTHVPRDEVAPLLARIRGWLRPGGSFIATMGVEDDPGGIEDDWLGVHMYFSHFSARGRTGAWSRKLASRSTRPTSSPSPRIDSMPGSCGSWPTCRERSTRAGRRGRRAGARRGRRAGRDADRLPTTSAGRSTRGRRSSGPCSSGCRSRSGCCCSVAPSRCSPPTIRAAAQPRRATCRR